MRHTRLVSALALGSLTLGACVTDLDDAEVAPPVAESGDGSADRPLDDAPDPAALDSGAPAPAGDAETSGPLAFALTATRDASAFHADVALGMEMDLGMGEAVSLAPDASRPMIRIDVDAEGESSVVVDLSAAASGLDGPGAAAVPAGTAIRTWIDGSNITVDMTAIGALTGPLPGPLAVAADSPFVVDGARLGGSDVAQQVTGESVPDPTVIADLLLGALGDSAVQDPDDPRRFTGMIDFLTFSVAFGQEDPFGPMGGAFDGLVADPAAAATALEDMLSAIVVEVEIVLDGDVVDRLRFDVDMSPMFADLPALAEATGNPIPPDQVAMFEQMFADAVFSFSMIVDYEIDPSIDVVVPTGDFPDLTDEFLAFYALEN